MEQEYRVILSGQLKPGWSLERAAQALAKLIGCDAARATKLIKNSPTKMKNVLPLASAQKHKAKLEQTGVICSLDPLEPEPEPEHLLDMVYEQEEPLFDSLDSSASGVSLSQALKSGGLSLAPAGNESESSGTQAAAFARQAEGGITCPKCETQQAKAAQCSSCGIYFHKYQQQQQRLAGQAVSGAMLANAGGAGIAAEEVREKNEVEEHPALTHEQVAKLLKNTYSLLSMTLIFSAFTAYIGMGQDIQNYNGITVLVGGLILLGITYATRTSVFGLLSIFAFTGWMGYWIGPTLNFYLTFQNGGTLIGLAAGMTAVVFFSLSGYVLVSKKDFSFMGSFLFVGLIVILLGWLSTFFIDMPAFQLALSAMGVLIFSGYILYDTSQMIHGGETNYIMATVNLYLDVINLFLDLLHLLAAFAGEE